VPNFPRLRALALFGRRLPRRVEAPVIPASENQHNSGHIARALVSPIRWYYTLSHSAHNSLGVGPETA
jgi:hypothetical protein